jgi:lipopolysaccharide/colanic/teichoic acid biosynthesis glycosyltransferase
MTKRAFDLLVSLWLLSRVWPLMLMIALAIWLESGGPIFYVSQRVGQDGRLFKLYGFRTMLPDQRTLTRTGRFTRNFSLDHLPNLLNIVKGDMSLVGPRPHEPHQVDLADPLWRQALTVKPGVVSWAILHFATTYNQTPYAERNQIEAEYIERQSFLFDLYVLWVGLAGLVASGGNVKARGKPRTDT